MTRYFILYIGNFLNVIFTEQQIFPFFYIAYEVTSFNQSGCVDHRNDRKESVFPRYPLFYVRREVIDLCI
jgi:hypothetical protein